MKLDGQIWPQITRLVDLKVKSCYLSNGVVICARTISEVTNIARVYQNDN